MYTETFTSTASAAANLNQAQNTVLHTFVATKPGIIRRYGAVADNAAGLLAASRLKLRLAPAATGTAADVPNSVLVGAVRARGLGIVKTLPDRVEFVPGDTITICSEVAAGGTSTAALWIEIEPLPAQQAEQPNMVESA